MAERPRRQLEAAGGTKPKRIEKMEKIAKLVVLEIINVYGAAAQK